MSRNKPRALYLHVPFCRTICHYCDFCHVIYRHETADRWLNALQEEIREKDIAEDLSTIYIGGGTPSALDAGQLERLLGMLDPYCQNCEEYTVEINPGTLDRRKTEILAAHGVSRASIGFQTDSERLLKMIGRHHTAEDTAAAVSLLREYGIRNISLDLMYSLPEQTMADLVSSVSYALSLEPMHLSLYSLTVEENTVFGRKGYRPLDEETEADMYEYICRVLPEAGYRQYEISNFCRDGFASRHNLVYWHYEDFCGLSAGASGKENHCRYDNTSSLKEYLQNPLQREVIPLSREDEMFEAVMMGLRLKDGISLHSFQDRFGISFVQAFGTKAEELLSSGRLVISDGQLKCGDEYYHLLNSVLSDLL